MSVRVYRYGLRSPTESANVVRDQMRAAHRYRNTLIEIERGRRAALRAVASSHGEVARLELAVATADAEVEAAERAAKAAKSEARSRTAPIELRNRLASVRAAKKEALAALREARRRDDMGRWLDAAKRGEQTGLADVDAYLASVIAYEACEAGPNAVERVRLREAREEAAFTIQDGGAVDHPVRRVACADAVNLRAQALCRSARAASGLTHGTYSLVEEAMAAARKAPLYDGAEPNDPRFIRWTGEGRVGVQVQGGIGAPALFGSDTRVRVGEIDEIALTSPTRGERRHAAHTTLRLRIGSEGRDPVWASWPIELDRPLPEGAVVRAAVVSLRRIGPTEEWSAELTVECPLVTPSCGSGAVAIDLGWRKLRDRKVRLGRHEIDSYDLRVGSWLGEDGAAGEIVLSAEIVASLVYPDTLRAIRDRIFDAERARLAGWLRGRDVPGWLREATRYLPQWKSADRLAALAIRWRDNRFDGDDGGYGRRPTLDEQKAGVQAPGIEGWRCKDKHLWTWEASQRHKAGVRRRELYRCAAADLAKRYGVLVLEDFDLSRVARALDVADESEDNKSARHNRVLASPSECRLALVNAFDGRGGTVGKLPAANTTRKCSACNHVEAFDAAAMLHRQCPACKATYDQDENAAENLLAAWRERSGGASDARAARSDEKANDPAPVRESRFVRARRLRAEKEAARRTAREAQEKAAE